MRSEFSLRARLLLGTILWTLGLFMVTGIVTTVLMLALEYLVFHTKLGTAMRAVSYSPDTAALMGIPVDRVVTSS